MFLLCLWAEPAKLKSSLGSSVLISPIAKTVCSPCILWIHDNQDWTIGCMYIFLSSQWARPGFKPSISEFEFHRSTIELTRPWVLLKKNNQKLNVLQRVVVFKHKHIVMLIKVCFTYSIIYIVWNMLAPSPFLLDVIYECSYLGALGFLGRS